MEKESKDFIRFIVRVLVVTASLILVLFLFKTWFFPSKQVISTLSPNTPPAPSNQQSAVRPNESAPEKSGNVISWEDAGSHIGEYATVAGTIVAAHNSGKACFLNFHPNYRIYFTAVIFASSFNRFPSSPERYYLNKRVQVTGRIKEYKGKPEIILNDPSQISIQ
ncbi:hypothetical protein HY768_10170 [candidate division TA06 bacterium]|uniref:OB domain-containing protein n=1 Tax=candidate division TA06 bacterium TaxID=2250710 RepID=A0A933IB53_UNCT6|nr:hypothetical protein [candidate division TA06 bacterium]